MKDKRNPKQRENEVRANAQIGENDVRIRPHAISTHEIYDIRSKEYNPTDRAPSGLNENGYGLRALSIRALRDVRLGMDAIHLLHRRNLGSSQEITHVLRS